MCFLSPPSLPPLSLTLLSSPPFSIPPSPFPFQSDLRKYSDFIKTANRILPHIRNRVESIVTTKEISPQVSIVVALFDAYAAYLVFVHATLNLTTFPSLKRRDTSKLETLSDKAKEASKYLSDQFTSLLTSSPNMYSPLNVTPSAIESLYVLCPLSAVIRNLTYAHIKSSPRDEHSQSMSNTITTVTKGNEVVEGKQQSPALRQSALRPSTHSLNIHSTCSCPGPASYYHFLHHIASTRGCKVDFPKARSLPEGQRWGDAECLPDIILESSIVSSLLCVSTDKGDTFADDRGMTYIETDSNSLQNGNDYTSPDPKKSTTGRDQKATVLTLTLGDRQGVADDMSQKSLDKQLELIKGKLRNAEKHITMIQNKSKSGGRLKDENVPTPTVTPSMPVWTRGGAGDGGNCASGEDHTGNFDALLFQRLVLLITEPYSETAESKMDNIKLDFVKQFIRVLVSTPTTSSNEGDDKHKAHTNLLKQFKSSPYIEIGESTPSAGNVGDLATEWGKLHECWVKLGVAHSLDDHEGGKPGSLGSVEEDEEEVGDIDMEDDRAANGHPSFIGDKPVKRHTQNRIGIKIRKVSWGYI